MGTVSLDREGSLARLTLSNPAKFNAMSRSMWRELKARVDDLSLMPDLRCVILAGEGGHFCAGGDIAEYPAFRFDETSLRNFHECEVWPALQALLDCPMPLLAQIEGNCMGAGLEMASCCDIRLASASARFGAPIARLGFPMAPREARLVARELGTTVARSMLLEASVYSAEALLNSGFLTAVVSETAVAGEAGTRAQRIAALGPQSARLNKQTLLRLQADPTGDPAWADAYAYASNHEHREGIAAFLAKRTPVF
jgi:enoyl-CoA hydratase/carnithine racemase